MEYAEAMSQTPPTVTDELSAELLDQLGAGGAGGAHRVHRARQPVHPHERRARHRVPGLLGGRVTSSRSPCPPPHDRRPVRHPPQPALHRRLRDARLRRRRRGRGAGDLAAVGRRRPLPRCCDSARLPGPDRHPAGAQPAADAVAAARGVRRRVAARAAAHQPRRGRGRRVRRERLDRDADRAGDARRPPSGRSSSCARSSTCPTPTSPRRSTRRPPRSGRSRTGRASTWLRGGRGSRSSRAEQQQVVERFLAALQTGDVQALLDVLAPDVVLVADGGGEVAAARRPVRGPTSRWRACCRRLDDDRAGRGDRR